MLKKQFRLKTNYEFGRVRRFGIKYRSPDFDIYYLDLSARFKGMGSGNSIPSNAQFPSRFGIVISNKFSKLAVVRNRVKRVYREVLRSYISNILEGFWIVIYPKESCIKKGYEEINTEFNKVLPKLPFYR